jgi:hypothetical protein
MLDAFKNSVLEGLVCAIQHHKPGLITLDERVLGDKLLGQVIIEIG